MSWLPRHMPQVGRPFVKQRSNNRTSSERKGRTGRRRPIGPPSTIRRSCRFNRWIVKALDRHVPVGCRPAGLLKDRRNQPQGPQTPHGEALRPSACGQFRRCRHALPKLKAVDPSCRWFAMRRRAAPNVPISNPSTVSLSRVKGSMYIDKYSDRSRPTWKLRNGNIALLRTTARRAASRHQSRLDQGCLSHDVHPVLFKREEIS